MTDPRRWLDDPAALDDEELRVLIAGRDASPPSRMRGAVWAALAARLPVAEAAAAAKVGTVASTGTGIAGASASSILKALAVGLAAGSVAMGGVTLTAVLAEKPAVPTRAPMAPLSTGVSRAHVTPRPENPVDVAIPADERSTALSPSPAPAVERKRALDRATAAAEPAPSATVATFPASEEAPSAAEETNAAVLESQLIASARQLVRAGDVSGAAQTLERVRARFPNGALVQEREALTVEVFAARDQRALARERAATFLRAYPKSPYAARVRALAGL